jgi:hypothetical protein
MLPAGAPLAAIRTGRSRLSNPEVLDIGAVQCRRRIQPTLDGVCIQHFWTAYASGSELETQLEIGRRIEIVTEKDAERLIADAQEVGRIINELVRALERGTIDRDN